MTVTLSAIDAAITQAIHGLCAAQRPRGWWADFQLAPGTGSLWVTGYVGGVLARTGDPEAMRAARRAWDFLESWEDGGWGFNLLTPKDADSTGWALALAARLGLEQPAAALAALERHGTTDGGVATYTEDSGIHAFVQASEGASFAGWCGACDCVSAAIAAQGPLRPGLAAFLLRRQRADGRWQSYWWVEDAYATAFAGRALARAGEAEAVARACAWAAAQIDDTGRVASEAAPDGSAFAAALLARLLAVAEQDATQRSAFTRIWRDLLGRQRADGLWDGDAGLRVPPPHCIDPETCGPYREGLMTEGALCRDQCGFFTTATVLAALLDCRASAAALLPESEIA
jgi:hypothetical protein